LLEDCFYAESMPSYYADLLHISPNYLNKICKEERGTTAGDMIRKRIAIEAERLLHYTSLSVSEIASKLGFNSASYFATFFKKQTGESPETFRSSAEK